MIKNNWKTITVIYCIGAFLYLFSYKQMPLSYLVIAYVLFFLVTKIVFLGNTFASLGYSIHVFTKNTHNAMPFYEKGVSLGTNNKTAMATYSLCLLKNGDFKKAKEIYENILTLNPNNQIEKIVQTNLAICHWKLGDLSTATEVFENVINNPSLSKLLNVDDFTTLGYIYIEKREFDKALEYTNKALDINPNYASAIDNIAQIYYYQDDFINAEEYFKKALSIKETLIDSNYYMGILSEMNGDTDSAKKYYETALKGNITALNIITRDMIENKYNLL